MESDRGRWNAKWREQAGELEAPSAFLDEHARLLPPTGRALDVAGGAGRNAVWLARHGLDVTLIDISDVAIDRAEQRANRLGIKLRLLQADLDHAELPAPVFDVVVIANYLNRERRDEIARLLHAGGLLVAMHPTVFNLARHEKPGLEYLLGRGELEAWVRDLGMDVVVAREDWTDEGRHEAQVIARRAAAAPVEITPEDSGPSEGPYR